jgi:DNA-binding CsgD family transcriptional regulator/GAF domain-containing protein
MRDDERTFQLIASIYEAAVKPTLWPSALERIADALGHASIALITTEDFDKPIDVWLANYDPACTEARFRHYARPEANPSVRASMQIEPLSVVPRKRFITDRDFETDPACQALLIAQKLYHGCTVTLHRAGTLLSALEVYRPKPQKDFDPSEIRLLQRLAPHMANALRVNREVSASQVQQHQAEEALNQLNVGVLLLTQGGRIVFANRVAARLLHLGDGITSRDGKLAPSLPLDSARMACVIARAATRAEAPPMAQALCVHRGGDRRPLHLWAIPLLRESSSMLVRASQADVMVIVTDPELGMAPPPEALRALYGLTEAEARLTSGLLQGERLEDYAARVGISINTARTHLKSVFAKTDTNRQAELMRLLSRGLCDPE